jgi:metallophosphoesterase (TIGR03768 family)
MLTLGVLPCVLLCNCGGSTQAPSLTTRQVSVRPVAVSPDTPPVNPKDVAQYGAYSAWRTGPGEDQGRKLDLMPPGYGGAPAAARLLSFFAMSDIHITDKESPAQVPYFGWSALFGKAGLYSQAYSPVLLSTTQVLDAAVQTVNALHQQTPFQFGIMLGDVANSGQFNELRWFLDVMDGKLITPSSGAHLGADTIAYQKPFQAAGLDRAIPWYQVVGNHDQFWMGVAYPKAKLQQALVGSEILNIGINLFATNNADATGVYVGVVDGATPYGDVVKGGPAAAFPAPPVIIPDPSRHSVVTPDSLTATFTGECFNSSTLPAGHGFDPAQSGGTSACYTFEPVANLPLKVIVLDDTCKAPRPEGGVAYYGSGWIDSERLACLTRELQKGQDAGQLMILAAHIPINPQKDLFDRAKDPQFYPGSAQTDAQLIATLHGYPNLILLIAGHRHKNTVTPQPSPDPSHPEYGFWEVETSSLRDFPRQFRTFEILRNRDNSISILATNVDPQVEPGSIAEASLGYAVGAARIFGNIPLADTTSHVFNAELVKALSPAMQAKIAALGTRIAP